LPAMVTGRWRGSALVALSCVLAAVFVFLPLALSRGDMWDGTITAYALDLGRLEGLRTAALDNGWVLGFLLTSLEQSIVRLPGLSFALVNLALVVAGFLLLMRETFLLARRQFGMTTAWAALVVCLLVAFPAWNVLMSSVMTIFLICLALGMLGVRLAHADRRALRVAGLILVAISLQLNSLLVFAPVLSYVFDVSRAGVVRQRWRPSLTTLTILAIAIGYYALQKLLLPHVGLYEGYNETVNVLSPGGIGSLAQNGLRFASFLAIPMAGVVVMVVVAGILGSAVRSSDDSADRKAPDFRLRNAMAILLVAGAIFPYAMVGKSASLVEFIDWTGRHAFVLAPALAILACSYLYYLRVRLTRPGRDGRLIVGLAVITMVAIELVPLSYGFASKLNRQAFERDLQPLLATHRGSLPPGTLQIVGDGIPGPVFRVYESNYLLYRGTGAATWWTRIGARVDPGFSIPAWLDSPERERTYVFTPASSSCSTVMSISAHGYGGAVQVVRNALGIGRRHYITVDSIESTCP
jgi:hypothetical protein